MELKFVDGIPRDHAHAARVRREVRSHAARSAAQEQDGPIAVDGAKRRRPRKQCQRWTLEIRTDVNQGQNNGSSSSPSISPLTPLSGNDLIPASKSPVYHEPFVSLVVENCKSFDSLPLSRRILYSPSLECPALK